jgi:hypothetical protein
MASGQQPCLPPPCAPAPWQQPRPYVTPGAPTTPGTTAPGTTPPATTTPDMGTGAGMDMGADTGFGSLASGAGVGSSVGVTSAVNYVDSAVIQNMFRLRFDAAYDDNRPDRAEFFYAKCGCLRNVPIAKGGDANAPGPPLMETSVNYQDISPYLEYAFSNRFSMFVEAPFRFLNPEINQNKKGFYDMNAGFKAGIISCPEQLLTFQFRTYFPTGDSEAGLGTNHYSLEPALLYWRPLSERWLVETEFRAWIPVGGTDFEGDILRYGIGLSYFIFGSPNKTVNPEYSSRFFLAPIAEFVGWTVLNGKELDGFSGPIVSAAGDTIVNAKVGVRMGIGDYQSFSVSYGRALTGDVWYKDIFRVEYRLAF